MKKNYSNKDLEGFFKAMKEMPQTFKIEKVHQLLNNPEAKATLRSKTNFKPFNFIIMLSAFVITAGILFLFPVQNDGSIKKMMQEQVSSNESFEKIEKEDLLSTISDQEKKKKPHIICHNAGDTLIKVNVENKIKRVEIDNENAEKLCSWPLDTLIDKHSLYVYLSNSELRKIGIFIYDSALIYNNQADWSSEKDGFNVNMNFATEPIKETHFSFSASFISDSACTTYRWGHPFYEQIDTLLPVFVDVPTIGKQLFWFNVNDELFKALPSRYLHLQAVFKQLICVKSKNPQHQFVNYLTKSNNIILDEINYLELSFTEFGKLGIKIEPELMEIKHPTAELMHILKGEKSFTTTWGPYPPNPLPLLVTDEKGLEQEFFGWRDSVPLEGSWFDLLVPVKMPLNQIFAKKDYFEIFWFVPTKQFIDSLPDRYREILRKEYQEIIDDKPKTEQSTCTFFEACKSTLYLEDLKLFPNPSNGFVEISFHSANETTAYISVATISGNLVKELASNQLISKGYNQFTFDLSNLPSGMYLLFIKTTDAFKTQRLILSK